ncbi:MAG: type II secretion system protein GspM [Woeseiaceae bacterium]
MKDWFDGLEQRERTMVLLAAVFVALAVLYLAVWAPLDRAHKGVAASVQTWKTALADLRPLRVRMQSTAGTTANAAGQGQSLVVVVDSTLRQRGLYSSLQRSQPTAQNSIRLEFENTAFDDLVLWLGDLSGAYGMQVQSGSFSRNSSSEPGRVNATLILER